MSQKVKQAKIANRKREQIVPELPSSTHRHRCNVCGDWWLHDDPKCRNILLCYMLCTTCSSALPVPTPECVALMRVLGKPDQFCYCPTRDLVSDKLEGNPSTIPESLL